MREGMQSVIMGSSPFARAVARLPGQNFDRGITSSNLGKPDHRLMLTQHGEYVRVLRELGVEVILLDPLPDHPDAYFVEDTAVVAPEFAVIANPGAEARKGEEEPIAQVLAGFRSMRVRIRPPGTLDGGDVLQAGSHFFIGLSGRTNPQGVEQLGGVLTHHGYTWTTVAVEAGLHLKSSVSCIGKDTLLVADALSDHEAFHDYPKIVLDPDDAYAANSLWINGTLIVPKGFPGAKKKLKSAGFNPVELDVSEARKMDGGLSCMSIRF